MLFQQFLDIIVGFQLLFFGVILIFYRKNNLSNYLLSVFMLAKCMIYIRFLGTGYFGFSFLKELNYKIVFESFYFLLAPSVYLYVKSMLFPNFRINKKQLLHLVIPFVFGLTHRFVFDVINLMVDIYSNNIPKKLMVYVRLIFSLGYFITALIIIIKKQKKIGTNSIDNKKFSWLKILVISLAALWFLESVPYFIHIIFDYKIPNSFLYIEILFFFILVGLMLISFKFSEMFDISNFSEKYNYSGLSEGQKLLYIKSLDNYMSNKKPYLNPDLNLDQLSSELKIPKRNLSQIINEKKNMHFREYINHFRLHESINMLKNPTFKKKTILEILYDSGFSSKSSFNELFVKKIGLSPTEFRKTSLD